MKMLECKTKMLRDGLYLNSSKTNIKPCKSKISLFVCYILCCFFSLFICFLLGILGPSPCCKTCACLAATAKRQKRGVSAPVWGVRTLHDTSLDELLLLVSFAVAGALAALASAPSSSPVPCVLDLFTASFGCMLSLN